MKKLIFLIILAIIFGFLAFSKEIETKEYVSLERCFIGRVKPIVIPGETRTVILTAYSSSVDETDSTPFTTASGTITRKGVIACPRKYSFGTLIKIDDEWYVCEDRLSLKYDDRFDIWVSSKEEALKFGYQKKIITIYQ